MCNWVLFLSTATIRKFTYSLTGPLASSHLEAWATSIMTGLILTKPKTAAGMKNFLHVRTEYDECNKTKPLNWSFLDHHLSWDTFTMSIFNLELSSLCPLLTNFPGLFLPFRFPINFQLLKIALSLNRGLRYPASLELFASHIIILRAKLPKNCVVFCWLLIDWEQSIFRYFLCSAFFSGFWSHQVAGQARIRYFHQRSPPWLRLPMIQGQAPPRQRPQPKSTTWSLTLN